MKLLGTLLIYLLSAFTTQSPASFQVTQEKLRYEGFVEVEALGKETLFRNALNYSSSVQKVGDPGAKPMINVSEGLVQKTGSFMVYKKGLLTPQPHGEILYTLELKVNEEGYAYQFTDFVFQYYERNRYGRYEPVSGKKKLLEEEKFAGMQELWQQHKQTTKRHIEQHIKALSIKMQQTPTGAHFQEPAGEGNH